ncbi:MAG: hypothetical protein NTX20_01115 [Verrucomicrobia bacterium]|nr:hypothetical protein [Verrucomicrobiota bacterium]
MQKTLTLLALAALFVGCAHKNDKNADAPHFSWEKEGAPVAAVEDASKARIVSVREDLGLIAFARTEKPEVKTHLRLEKEGKSLEVEVIKTDDQQVVVGIVPNQSNAVKFTVGEVVGCSVAAAPVAAPAK